MRPIKGVGLVLLAAVVLAGMIAGTASAAPEFKVCMKVAKGATDGEFSDKACGEAEAGGKYKLAPFSEAKKAALSLHNRAAQNFAWIPLGYPGYKRQDAECSEGHNSKGTYEATGATFKLEYAGCELESTRTCSSAYQPPRVIVSEELEGTLVDLPEGKHGLDITSAADPGGTFMRYNCEGIEFDEVGSVIAEIQGDSTEALKSLSFNLATGPDGVQQQ